MRFGAAATHITTHVIYFIHLYKSAPEGFIRDASTLNGRERSDPLLFFAETALRCEQEDEPLLDGRNTKTRDSQSRKSDDDEQRQKKTMKQKKKQPSNRRANANDKMNMPRQEVTNPKSNTEAKTQWQQR